MDSLVKNISDKRDELVHAFESAQGDFQAQLHFTNGYGVSVIRSQYTYGGRSGLFELAVLKDTGVEWDMCYDTEITGDVLGWLTAEEVVEYMERVSKL